MQCIAVSWAVPTATCLPPASPKRVMDGKGSPMANPHRPTTDQVLELIKAETGNELSASTFRGYVSRGQAPAPVEWIGRTPLFKRSEIAEWARNRPGQGARTDLRTSRRRRAD